MSRVAPAAMAFCLALSAASACAGLINGSFETPLVPNGSFTNFAGGSSAIAGWTVVGVDTAIVNTNFVQSGIQFQAHDGNQWADLAGVTSNSQSSGLSQTVATTIGASYTLGFWVGSATDGRFFFPTTVDLSINGGARTHYTNPAAPTDHLDWKQFLVVFTATSAATNITFYNGGTPNNFLNGLDDVTLTEVPEPASVALLLAGAPCVAGLVRLRRRHG